MSNYYRYPTIFKNHDKYAVILGIHHCHRGDTGLIELPEKSIANSKFKLAKVSSKILLTHSVHGYAIHNFAICPDKMNKFYYGIGGLNRNQSPYNDRKHGSGITLFKSKKLNGPWQKEKTLVNIKNVPKNPTLGIEQTCPEFDSNICFIYSQLLKSYLIFCRANIAKGCRGVQMLKTSDFKSLSSFNLLQVDTFVKSTDNYYMFKCVEILQAKLFFALVPYTNAGKNPTDYYIKKLISKDAIHWKDCGKYCDAKMSDDNKHLDTHIGEILISNGNLEIILLLNCTGKNARIKRHVHSLSSIDFVLLNSSCN